MFYKEFIRKPTSLQIANALQEAHDGGHVEAEIMRGEAGYAYVWRMRQWHFSHAPGGGHTITHACAMKALVIVNGTKE